MGDDRNIPRERTFSAAARRLPARTTTDVVPSPASISWAAESSTSYFASGRKTRISHINLVTAYANIPFVLQDAELPCASE